MVASGFPATASGVAVPASDISATAVPPNAVDIVLLSFDAPREETDMPTRPKNDARSIATDARRVLDAARGALKDDAFKARASKREIDAFEVNIAGLEAGDGARTCSLHA
jgi:hypothetical protein